jgi:transcriptional regulator with XRE-family HTH domain
MKWAGFPEGKGVGDGRQNAAVSIGEVLAEARHRRGWTVAEVSHYTRIREPVIRALERDDYILSGGDFGARDQIGILATALGVDARPLIAAFDASLPSPADLDGTEAVRSTIPFRIKRIRRRRRRRLGWLPVLTVLVLAAIGGAAYYVVAGRPGAAARPAPAAASDPGTPLVPARALAFGPGGPDGGDNPQQAVLAIDHDPATAWTTGWYGTPRFPDVQQGTGLLLDMGRVVTLTGAEVTLGPVAGASFQLRAGDTPSLADLPEVAVATDARGPLGVRLTTAVRARYVLIWFTALPPVGSGTYQASVYNVTLLGASKPR